MTREQKLTLVATILGSGIVILDGTVVNVALPHISRDLGAGFSVLQWIVDGYLLSLSALILLGGSLGDILGRKRVYLIGLAGFGVASVLCGLAPNTTLLIAARLLQGVFGALLVPGGLAIINTNFAVKERGPAIGVWSAWSGIAAALGPLLGGYLVDSFSWRWIFFINAPLVLICWVLAKANVKETRDKHPRRVDYKGALLALAGLAHLTYGLIEGPAKNWDAASIRAVVTGILTLLLFIVVERFSRDPMVPLRLFRSRNFTAANIATFAMYGALSGFIFALVIYLQNTLHYSGIAAGAALVPVTVLMFLFSKRVGVFAGKLGPRIFMTTGPLIAAAGMLTLLNLREGSHYVTGVLPAALLFGCGLVLTVAPLTITVMSSVPDEDSGIASGINNAVSRVAGLIVIAMLGVLGASDSFRFSIVLCGILAAAAGIISLLLIRNPKAVAKS